MAEFRELRIAIEDNLEQEVAALCKDIRDRIARNDLELNSELKSLGQPEALVNMTEQQVESARTFIDNQFQMRESWVKRLGDQVPSFRPALLCAVSYWIH